MMRRLLTLVVILLGQIANAQTFTEKKTAIVDSRRTYWHSGLPLRANHRYTVCFQNTSWEYDEGIPTNYGGADQTVQIGLVAGEFRVGSIVMLVWQHSADGRHIPQIYRPSQAVNGSCLYLNVGNHGGSIHFLFADLPGAYGDNSGTATVTVFTTVHNGGYSSGSTPVMANEIGPCIPVKSGHEQCSVAVPTRARYRRKFRCNYR